MIPRIIHLCWFGKKEYPDLVSKCIRSWEEKMPDYTIMIWNEDSFDVNSISWTKEAYAQGKWAFVSDYVRLVALYKYGGIYLDTDMEVLSDISSYLNTNDFICSFIEGCLVSMGFIGTPSNSPIVKRLINYYESQHYLNKDRTQNSIMNTLIFTKMCIEDYGLRFGSKEFIGEGLHIYPFEYFMPYRKNLISNNISRRKNYIITSKTLMIHHDMGSWDKAGRIGKTIRGLARLIIPSRMYLMLKKIKVLRTIKKLKLESGSENE